MKAKRRRHDPEFKARVALEALKGIKPIQQIAKDFDVHPVQVSEWKKIMAAGAAGAFTPKAGGKYTLRITQPSGAGMPNIPEKPRYVIPSG